MNYRRLPFRFFNICDSDHSHAWEEVTHNAATALGVVPA
jgi:hypothetical protein